MLPRQLLLAPAAVLLASTTGAAQVRTRVERVAPQTWSYSSDRGDEHRAALGIVTSSSVTPRDTIGLLITGVTPGSPAERAGLEEGNRLTAINSVSLRLSAADVDAPEMRGIMQRRLTRELAKVKPGDEVELRVYASGQSRTLRVRTADADSLFRRASDARDEADERATLGVAAGPTGTMRDTLGVFLMAVDDSGPAAKAGIFEGARIAGINNVDLRISRADAGDDLLAEARARRLQREVSQLKPGDEVELRVWQNGQMRSVKVKAVSESALPHRRMRLMIGDGAMLPMPGGVMGPIRMSLPRVDIDGPRMRMEIEQSMTEAMRGLHEALDGMQLQFDDDDVAVPPAPPAPPTPPTAKTAPRATTVIHM